MKQTFQISGMVELGRAFAELDGRVQKRVRRNALAAGARVFRDAARAKAPVLQVATPTRKPGTLKKAITVKVDRPHGSEQEARVWVKGIGKAKIAEFKKASGKGGAANPDDPFYHWMVEFGTVKMPARPYMRPAFEESKFAAADAVKSRISNGIEKEASDIGRTIGKA